jgi:membrane protease YdiL (CAAX protease family)
MAIIAGIAFLGGALDPASAPRHKSALWLILTVNFVSVIPLALLTEEGFFRGWLWASLQRSAQKTMTILILTSAAFALWHWSSAVLPTGFNPPLSQLPIYMINAAVIGANWGMLRLLSGSLLVTSLSHSVWNGLAYVLFGFGSSVGSLGIANTGLYGPEVGTLGLMLNLAVAVVLWAWCGRESAWLWTGRDKPDTL